MLVWIEAEEILEIIDFDREVVIARLDEGLPVIPLWLDRVHQCLERQLKAYNA
jgi:hypothetical protein